jgi:hypothetical protein
MNPLDIVLNRLEDLTETHPFPMTRDHCEYCSAWLVIMEVCRPKEDE